MSRNSPTSQSIIAECMTMVSDLGKVKNRNLSLVGLKKVYRVQDGNQPRPDITFCDGPQGFVRVCIPVPNGSAKNWKQELMKLETKYNNKGNCYIVWHAGPTKAQKTIRFRLYLGALQNTDVNQTAKDMISQIL